MSNIRKRVDWKIKFILNHIEDGCGWIDDSATERIYRPILTLKNKYQYYQEYDFTPMFFEIGKIATLCIEVQ